MTQVLPQTIRTKLGDQAANDLVNWVGNNHKNQLDLRLDVTEGNIRESEARLDGNIREVKAVLEFQIKEVASQIRESETRLEGKMSAMATKDDLSNQLKWIIGFMISQTGLMMAFKVLSS